jgi:putative ABC transport system permease protein
VIACANVANLLLARAVRREREFAMREALGARRGRLLRQLFAENMMLLALGGAGGLGAGTLILRSLPYLLPKETPRLHEVTLDTTFLALAAAGLLITVALFGAAPMLRMWRSGRELALVRSAGTGRPSSRLSLALIGAELALATLLLIGAGLMARTLVHLNNVDTGIRAEHVVSARIAAGRSRCGTPQRCLSLIHDLNRVLLGIGGVRSVNWSNFAPLDQEH